MTKSQKVAAAIVPWYVPPGVTRKGGRRYCIGKALAGYLLAAGAIVGGYFAHRYNANVNVRELTYALTGGGLIYGSLSFTRLPPHGNPERLGLGNSGNDCFANTAMQVALLDLPQELLVLEEAGDDPVAHARNGIRTALQKLREAYHAQLASYEASPLPTCYIQSLRRACTTYSARVTMNARGAINWSRNQHDLVEFLECIYQALGMQSHIDHPNILARADLSSLLELEHTDVPAFQPLREACTLMASVRGEQRGLTPAESEQLQRCSTEMVRAIDADANPDDDAVRIDALRRTIEQLGLPPEGRESFLEEADRPRRPNANTLTRHPNVLARVHLGVLAEMRPEGFKAFKPVRSAFRLMARVRQEGRTTLTPAEELRIQRYSAQMVAAIDPDGDPNDDRVRVEALQEMIRRLPLPNKGRLDYMRMIDASVPFALPIQNPVVFKLVIRSDETAVPLQELLTRRGVPVIMSNQTVEHSPSRLHLHFSRLSRSGSPRRDGRVSQIEREITFQTADGEITYELESVALRPGGQFGGHFKGYVASQKKGSSFYKVNDSRVSKASAATVLQAAAGHNGYMVTYRKK